MGWQLLWIFLSGLIDHYWWLLGVVFMVEPWLDAHVEAYRDWADQYVSRQARARISWTLSFLCLFIASMWAFSDEYWSHQGDLKSLSASVSASQQQYVKQKQRGDDLDNLIHGKGGYLDQIDALNLKLHQAENKPPKTVVERVQTTGSNLGKNRDAILGPLQKFYAAAGSLQSQLISRDATDALIDTVANATDNWVNSTALWIGSHMGDAARSRFMNNSDKVTYVFDLSGEHKPGKRDLRDKYLNVLAGCMTNLETLMRSDEFDPQH